MIQTLCCLLAIAGPALPTPSAPDIVPPGWHGVDVERHLDLEALRDRCCVQHVVSAGETLSEIAARACGGAERAAEILALNPGVDPRRLDVGAALWLPPRTPGARLRFAFVNDWLSPESYRPVTIGQSVYAKYGTFTFLVVEDAHRARFEAEKSTENIERMAAADQLLTFSGESHDGLERNGSPVTRVVERVSVTYSDARGFAVKCRVSRLDASGDEVAGGTGRPVEADASLLLLSLAGAGALLALLRRRARATA